MKKRMAVFGILLLLVAGMVFASGARAGGSSEAASATGPFDWKRYSGATIRVAMVTHATTDAIQSRIDAFTQLTGIKVETSVTPETNYFDRVSSSLSSKSGDPDLFMSGAYQLWDYSTAGYVEDLGPYLNNSSLTASDYDFNDILKSTSDALKWDGIAGHSVGTGRQLALPLACEVYTLAYNKRAFQKVGIQPPRTYEELLVACDKLQGWNGPGSYALATRGIRDWGTIHPGYMSTYANFGAKDFAIEGGKLVSKVNSPESVRMNTFWVDLIKRGGPANWANYSWYDCQVDMGEGKAAMCFDADNNIIQKDFPGTSPEAGNLAWIVMPLAKVGDVPHSNFWTWAMAMNSASKNKGAAWLFLQYVTSKEFALYASVTMNNLDPTRKSVWDSTGFQRKMASHDGWLDSFNKTINSTTILFTPQPMFFQTTTEWASTLQDMVAGRQTVQTALDDLKRKTDNAVRDVPVR